MIAYNHAVGSPGGPSADDEAIARDDVERALNLAEAFHMVRLIEIQLHAWEMLASTTTDGVLRAAQARKFADSLRRIALRFVKRVPLSGPDAPEEAPPGTRRRRLRGGRPPGSATA